MSLGSITCIHNVRKNISENLQVSCHLHANQVPCWKLGFIIQILGQILKLKDGQQVLESDGVSQSPTMMFIPVHNHIISMTVHDSL